MRTLQLPWVLCIWTSDCARRWSGRAKREPLRSRGFKRQDRPSAPMSCWRQIQNQVGMSPNAADHRRIDSGPYRFIRHESATYRVEAGSAMPPYATKHNDRNASPTTTPLRAASESHYSSNGYFLGDVCLELLNLPTRRPARQNRSMSMSQSNPCGHSDR